MSLYELGRVFILFDIQILYLLILISNCKPYTIYILPILSFLKFLLISACGVMDTVHIFSFVISKFYLELFATQFLCHISVCGKTS